MLNMKRNRLKSILLTAVAVILAFSLLPVHTFAASEQDTPVFSVEVSNKNPKKGEPVSVTVSIDNYKSMRYSIGAMYLDLLYDSSLFEIIENSGVQQLKMNTGDIAELGYNMDHSKISFGYVMANTKKAGLQKSTVEIFTVQMRVRSDIASDASAVFSLSDVKVYTTEESYRALPTSLKDDTVKVWTERPPILLNGNATNKGTYNETVEITFDAPSAKLRFDGGEEVIITSGYKADLNGTYTVKVESGGAETSMTFTVSKNIKYIGVKNGTFRTTYPMGVSPSYSDGILLITYEDGSYAEISLGDSSVSVSGFDSSKVGQQKLTFTYKNHSTSVTITVTDKQISSITVTSSIQNNTILAGSSLDLSGGVLTVVYGDFTSETISISQDMISGFDKNRVGTQNVTVTYGTATTTFSVTVISREAVDELISQIASLDLAALDPKSSADVQKIRSLVEKYNNMSAVEKAGVVNLSKLDQARSIMVDSGTETQAPPDSSGDDTSGQGDKGGNKVWIYVLIAIVALSIAGGAAYFIIVYIKKKREEEEYYDDDEDDDDFLDDDDNEDEEDDDEE